MATNELFERETPNYSGATFPTPRDFQDRAHQALRDGVKAGHQRQMLMAPTGGGKTYLGLRIAHEALAKGRRALFIADRRTLIDQTSTTADRYGLSAHGVLMSQHWRNDPTMPFQIASAQTLARREWPAADVIIVDEAHTQLAVWVDYIQRPECKAKVIGLSATPFSTGLGKIFTNLVNAATMAELTEAGVLVPLRVMSCKPANMEGAATSGGEWTDAAAGERGMEIVGDVVAEWLAHGENRKTIVFGSTIAHCAELCKGFNEAGVMAQLFTSETTEEERKNILNEYRKPDTMLRVLISVEALAKGFDVPDVSCVVDCRPLRKSLSTAIQMWGRGLRSSPETGKKDCLARGTLVLTDRGEVEIQHVTLDHKVWDGENFVQHGGAVCRGVQQVIEYDGLIATPDHEVWTNDGWTRIETAAHRGLRIARTGVGGQPVRLAQNRVADDARERLQPARGGPVRQMPGAALRAVPQHPQATTDGGLSALQWATAGAGARVAVSPLSSAVAAVHESACRIVRAVRWAWDRVPVCFRQRGGLLGGGKPGHPGSVDAAGPQGQQRPLRAWQPSLVDTSAEPEQHKGVGRSGEVHRLSHDAPAGQVCGRNAGKAHQSGLDGRADRGAMGGAIGEAQREVWDVLNAGPLQRFTANGRLVHNCLLLDHSGNIIRFADDYAEIFFNGLSALDAGEKLDKTIRKDDEDKTPKACPACGFKPMGMRCISCGHEVQRLSMVEAIPGHMREVVIGKTKLADNRRHLYEQLVSYTRGNGKPETAKGRAAHLFKHITGQFPDGYSYERTHNVPISKPVMNQVLAYNIARRHALAAERRGQPA